MLKKIPVSRLKPGMFVHELCGDWMSHPFWRAKFKLTGGDDLRRIVESGTFDELVAGAGVFATMMARQIA